MSKSRINTRLLASDEQVWPRAESPYGNLGDTVLKVRVIERVGRFVRYFWAVIPLLVMKGDHSNLRHCGMTSFTWHSYILRGSFSKQSRTVLCWSCTLCISFDPMDRATAESHPIRSFPRRLLRTPSYSVRYTFPRQHRAVIGCNKLASAKRLDWV